MMFDEVLTFCRIRVAEVIDFIASGGAITQASKPDKISRVTIYRWLNRDNPALTNVSRRPRKRNWQALAEDVV